MAPDREQLILEWKPQVDKWVKGFIAKHPMLWEDFEDLMGEANLKLVQIVDRFLDGKIDNLSVYLRLSIHTGIADFLRVDSVIPVRSEDQPVIETPHPNVFMDETPAEPDETLETLRKCTRDKCDRAILETRIHGGTIEATVQGTGYSRNTIRKRLTQMLARYEKMTS